MNKIIAVFVLVVFVFISCTTGGPNVNYKYPQDGVLNNAVLAVKDYQPIEIIFVKSTEVIDGNGNHTGSKITYEMLMTEAKKLGASDVINIKIDVNKIDDIENYVARTTYNYTASALAIKYTNAIQGDNRNITQNLENSVISKSEQKPSSGTSKGKTVAAILGVLVALCGIVGIFAAGN